MSDQTEMTPELHERKWEIDSLCYPHAAGLSVLADDGRRFGFRRALDGRSHARIVLKTFREQQRKEGLGPYTLPCA